MKEAPRASAAAIAAVLGAMALVVLDAAIANVALPVLTQDLHISPAAAIWVVTAYQLGLVVALLPAAALGDGLGHRPVFVGGLGVFTLASLLCAVAPSLPWLLAARFVQGLGGAAVMALGVALLRTIVPPERLGAAIGWNALVVALSTAAGPMLGSAILAAASWPWLFIVRIPLAVAVLLLTRWLPRPDGSGVPLDTVSVALNAVALAALVLATDQVLSRPVLAATLLGLSVAGFALLARRESPKAAPLIPIDLLRRRPFRLAVVASILSFAGLTAGLVALPFHLQHGLGLGLLTTGLVMTAWPLTVALAAPVVGRLSNRIAAAWLCAAGGLCQTIGLGAAALWPMHGNLAPLIGATMLCGLGFGLFNVPNNRTMFLSAPLDRSGAAGGMQGSARLLGQTAGTLLMTLLFALVAAAMAPRLGLAGGGGLTLAAGLVSLMRRDSGTPGTRDTLPPVQEIRS